MQVGPKMYFITIFQGIDGQIVLTYLYGGFANVNYDRYFEEYPLISVHFVLKNQE